MRLINRRYGFGVVGVEPRWPLDREDRTWAVTWYTHYSRGFVWRLVMVAFSAGLLLGWVF